MKATFQIPDELYREVKAVTARDGRTVRDVVISLFEQWLRQKKQPSPHLSAIDWENFQAPLAGFLSAEVTDHSRKPYKNPSPVIGMNPPEIRAALDTSVVMRLLTGQPSDHAAAARTYMAETKQAGAKVFVSNLVVMEAYFACQHHYGMPKQAVLEGLLKLFSLPTFIVHPQLLSLLSRPSLATAKPGFLDRLIHAEATTVRLPLVTFEKAAHRLPQTTILKAS